MSFVDMETRAHIHDLLCHFFLAFDQRDWETMRRSLSDEVFIDYASSGREGAGSMSADAFVSRRENALDDLSKQHSFSNLILSRDESGLRGRCNYLILRFAREGAADRDFYHSCGSYAFRFASIDGSWRISSITQMALKSWGDRSLHGGSRQT